MGNKLLAFLSKAAATCFFLTYIPERLAKKGSLRTGAGLIGTLAGVLTVRVLPPDVPRILVSLAGAILVSVAISDYAEELLGRHDDPRIVIDEWVGMWCAVAALPSTLPILAVGFVLFRFFDVFKGPWGRWAARFPGGWGIVLDDVLAGLFANGVLRLILFIHPF